MKIETVLILFVLALYSCNKEAEAVIEKKPLFTPQEIEVSNNCTNDILISGDTACYELEKRNHEKSGHGENFMLWSFMMANQYEYPEAHLDIFKLYLRRSVFGDLDRFYEIDSNSREFMLHNLDKAILLDVVEAKDIKSKINNLDKSYTARDWLGVKFYQNSQENQVYYEGSISAYNMLWLNSNETAWPLFFYLPLVMAHKYNYGNAYLDVFETIYYVSEKYIGGFDKLNAATKTFALKYLEIALSKNASRFVETDQYEHLLKNSN